MRNQRSIWAGLIGFVFSTFVFPSASFAADVPQTFTLDGQLFSDATGTTALLDSSISMKVQILDEDRVCILYEETQVVNTVFSKGYFSVQIGSSAGDPKRTGSDTANGMSTIFQNINYINGKKLSDNTPCAVTATGGKRRYVRIAISPSTLGGGARTLSPDLTIDSVPNAIVAERAESLQGYRSTDMLKVNTASGSALSQTNLESLFSSTTRFNSLSAVVDGTSTSYMRTSSAGAQLPVFTGAPTAPTQGSLWFDTSDQKMKYRTGVGTTEILGTSSGTLTSLTGDVSASGAGAVAATVNFVGTSTAANVHAAELLANAATSANTASTIVKRDASGNFMAGTITGNLTGNVTGYSSLNVLKAGDTMTGDLNFASGKGFVLTDSGTNTVSLFAPTTVTTNYVLKLPPAVASVSGQVLSSDTSGNLSWTSLPAAPVGSVAVTAPITNSGTASAPNISIPVATASANGYLASADWTIFNNKLTSTLANGSIFVGNGSNVATAVAPSQDASLTNAGAFTVTGLRGRSISATAPTDGQILKYVNGTTTWTPANFGAGDLLTSVGTSQFASASCAANQTLTWTSLTNTFTCSNIAGLDAAAVTTGTLPVARGGTGAATLTSGSLLVGADTSAVTTVAAGSSGNVLYGTGASSWASGTPDTAGLVDKASTQTISGAKSYTNTVQLNAQNPVRLYDSTTTNYVGIRSPASVTTSYTLNLPATQGGASTVLSNDGSGNLSWASPGVSLSSLTAASATNTIDSLDFAQNWNWSTATTQSPMSVSANALTTGSLLNITTSSASVNSTNGLLNVANSSATTTGVLARFQANSTAGSGMTVLNSGNVGIGIANPTAKLQVVGKFQSVASGGSVSVSNNTGVVAASTAGGLAIAGTSKIGLFTLGDDFAVYSYSGVNYFGGNVGVGTQTPSTILDISGGMTYRGVAAAAVPPTAAQGKIYFDSTANKFKVSENNGAYVDLVGGGASLNGTTSATVTFLGIGAGNGTQTGLGPTAIGYGALLSNVDGSFNTAVGAGALNLNTSGATNTAIGHAALNKNLVGEDSTAVGAGALKNSLANGNTAVGSNSMEILSTGATNTALGDWSGHGLTTGSSNTLIGQGAGSSITTGTGNVVLGRHSGAGIATATNNVILSDGAGNNRVQIDGSGNVGIGTTTPATSLDVAGGMIRATGWATAATGSGLELGYLGGGLLMAYDRGGGLYKTMSYSSLSHDFKISGTSKLVIDTSGNVGIGTAAPSSLLHLQKAGSLGVMIENTASTGYANLFLKGDARRFDIEVGASGVGDIPNKFAIWDQTAGAYRMTIDTGGNVGIGTTSPGARLDVADTDTTTSAIIVPRAGNFTGTNVDGMIRYNTASTLFEFRQNGSWVNYTTVSDGRLKTNVVPVVDGLGIVNQLNPVFYDWDRSNPKASGFEDKHQLGFIAQEVEKVLPEVVNKGADSYRSLEYGKIVSVVVAAVKELYSKVVGIAADVEALKSKNTANEREIASMKEENQALKARLEQQERELQAIKQKLGL